MKPFSNIAKRVLLASGLLLLAACSSNGPTDPTAAQKSGYLTVSATVINATASGYNVPAVTKPTSSSLIQSGPGLNGGTTVSSGYNVPAN